MRCSIIYNILESYGVVRRQLLYLSRVVPDNWEVIFVDDGSDPPIIVRMGLPFPFRMLYTEDKRFWTQGVARNLGAKHAEGEYLFMSDIDHIISTEAIEAIQTFQGTKMVFPRIKAVLDEDGNICQDAEVLRSHGCPEPYLEGPRGAGWNIFAMRREVFEGVGGYLEVSGYGIEDVDFSHRTGRYMREKRIPRHEVGPPIYLYPAPRQDIRGVFHSLRRRWTRHKIPQEPVPF